MVAPVVAALRGGATLALVLATLALVPSGAAASDRRCGPPDAHLQVVLLHAGAWFVDPRNADAALCRFFGAHGFGATVADYPMLDVGGSFEYASDLVRRIRASCDGCRVLAYGESAGGGIAAWLAARGEVDRGFAWAPVSNLDDWDHAVPAGTQPEFARADFRNATREDLERYSAVNAVSAADAAPLEVVHGPQDDVVPFAETATLGSRYPRAHWTLICADGTHLAPVHRRGVLRTARLWLTARGPTQLRRARAARPRSTLHACPPGVG